MSTTSEIGIAAIFKNEAPYVVEWIAHHRLLGIERFFIADNDSTDGTTELLQALEECGYIQLVRHPTQQNIKPQIPAYLELISRFSDQVEWLGFIDADEFIWPSGNEISFADHLRNITSKNPMVGAIVLNWATYGSSKQARYSPKPVTQRFTWRAHKQHPLNHNQKFFVRPKVFESFDGLHHCLLLRGYQHVQINLSPYTRKADANYAMTRDVIWEPFRLNHYIIKSYEEYVYKKSARGHAHSDHPLDRIFYLDRDENQEREEPSEVYQFRLSNEISNISTRLSEIKIYQELNDRYIKINSENTTGTELPVIGNIDGCDVDTNGTITIKGWAILWKQDPIETIELLINGEWVGINDFTRVSRIDVQSHYPMAHEFSGFVAKLYHHPKSGIMKLPIRAISPCGIPTETLGNIVIGSE